jgi:hypothetical protein
MESARAQELLDRVVAAVRRTPAGPAAEAEPEETLAALAALHDLRSQLLAWEPQLIEAARKQGASWARLATVLGVTSRQAAERRYLRLRPGDDAELTREERVQATRDERAGDRAVAAWARKNASDLRQIAGQVSGLPGLSSAGRRRARALISSMAGDDPVTLLAPLADMHRDLVDGHQELAEKVDQVSRRVRRVRRETQRRRASPAQS